LGSGVCARGNEASENPHRPQQRIRNGIYMRGGEEDAEEKFIFGKGQKKIPRQEKPKKNNDYFYL